MQSRAMSRLLDEPVLAAVVALEAAVVALLVAFGVDLTGGQQAALAGVMVAGLAVAVAVRQAVSPIRKRR